ncbi:MAG: peptide chain release factor N(5)-glutamine methyltransferase [Ignavibacteria bacterium]|nr:peptide chain release factor N(5)-glutamine methyltransferase [Ignavibacteria bacterium]
MNFAASDKGNSKLWTLGELIRWATNYLSSKSIESPRLTVELLLSHILNLSRLQLYLNFERPLIAEELNTFKSHLKRLLKSEPLQYILGETKFLENTIKLNRKVFIPRPETEILVKIIEDKYKSRKNEKLRILDIGCGSGAISVSLAKIFKNSNVLAIDIDPDCIEATKENALLSGQNNLIVEKLDILNSLPNGSFDIIVSNPPYISIEEYSKLDQQIYFEPKIALTDGADGLTFYRRFAYIFAALLSSSGSFFLEIGWNQSEFVKKIFEEKGFKLVVENDFAGIKRFVYSLRF